MHNFFKKVSEEHQLTRASFVDSKKTVEFKPVPEKPKNTTRASLDIDLLSQFDSEYRQFQKPPRIGSFSIYKNSKSPQNAQALSLLIMVNKLISLDLPSFNSNNPSATICPNDFLKGLKNKLNRSEPLSNEDLEMLKNIVNHALALKKTDELFASRVIDCIKSSRTQSNLVIR